MNRKSFVSEAEKKPEETPAVPLPELLRMADGTPVVTAEQWAARRKEILSLFETRVYGKMPDAAEDLPVDQHMLCALAAGKDRHMIIITGMMSEGWNNTEGQCLAYVASQSVWDLLGAGDQNNMIVHLDGHAILPSDMACILDYCDLHLRGKREKAVPGSPNEMKAGLFLAANRDRLDPAFDRFEAEIRSIRGYAGNGIIESNGG